MKFKNFKSAGCVLLCLVMLFVSLSFSASAVTQSGLEDKISNLEKQIQENQKKLDSLKDDVSNQESYINTLQAQINAVEKQMGALDDSITELSSQIASVQKEIDDLNANIEAKQTEVATASEKLAARLRSLYMAGEVSNVQILLSSEDFGTFLTRTELLKRVSDNDKELINQLKKDIEEMNAQKAELDVKKADLDAQKAELDSQQATITARQKQLTSLQNSAQSKLSQLNSTSQNYKNIIAQAEKDREAAAAELEAFIRANASNSNDGSKASATKGNMLWPVPYHNSYSSAGYGTYNPFGYAQNHRGYDITMAGAYGKNIVAAASGKVIKAVMGHPDDNYNQGWGNYIQIDHGGGIVTAYAHCSAVNVSVGQTVTAGQVIGKIGVSGRVTGAHLHFEVWVDGVREDPSPWLNHSH